MTWVPAFLFFLLNSEISALLSWKGGNEAGLPTTVAPLGPMHRSGPRTWRSRRSLFPPGP